ncbi:alpha/beta hydrolase [Polymorphobacter fuscus]|uniref:Alpha/beta hydrolase fold domain-containing protein n=1 Tax=Sandarakinorhabdus fusca TaxID=1439888 RepID=A0A7C9KX37_9SPHN|nr:alpha/beta hydrolase [Polymorphobacter fuscus]KAB7649005.1 alpha/beta hydrolase [Polymorphobacter fuscus]MQT16606.1 alpha/beta hydrolase fold domain-containing protein [Polymorphobacter fuscus]NJC07104.1 acetyl esterase [Polymorphobacter fuscus]
MPYVRADVQNLLAMLAAQPGPKMEDGDAPTARAAMTMMMQLVEAPRPDIAETKDLAIPGPAGTIPARLYRNSLATDPAPVLVFYHGGGWVIGDVNVYDSLCAEVCRTLNMTVVSVDYRLAPEHPFPAATEDCLAATAWVAGSPAEIGHPVSGLVPAGDSAGGNLAAVISQEQHGKLPVPILAQWLIYPATDMTATTGSMIDFADGYLLTAGTMEWFTRHYMGDQDLTHRWASPLLTESLAGQPPTLVYTCSLDPLRDQGRAYAAKLTAAGVRTIFREAEGQIHGSVTLRGGIPSAQDDLHKNLRALKLLIDEAA